MELLRLYVCFWRSCAECHDRKPSECSCTHLTSLPHWTAQIQPVLHCGDGKRFITSFQVLLDSETYFITSLQVCLSSETSSNLSSRGRSLLARNVLPWSSNHGVISVTCAAKTALKIGSLSCMTPKNARDKFGHESRRICNKEWLPSEDH
jgi:hypothetical protein